MCNPFLPNSRIFSSHPSKTGISRLRALGWVFYKKLASEPKAARAHLERALELQANEGIHLFRLGVLLRSLGEAERAQQQLERARKLDPSVA